MSERYNAFIKELASLLGRYGAEISITTDNLFDPMIFKPYGLHLPIALVEFEDPWEEHRLPNWINSEMDGGET